MKQKAFYLLAAVTMLIPACRQEQIDQDDLAGPKRMTTRIEEDAPETRTSFDGYYSIGNFVWNEGDQIAVHIKDAGYDIVDIIPKSGNPKLATFIYSKTSTNVRDYYAVYPASVADPDNYGNPTLKINLPTSYDISDAPASDFSPVPMVADNTVVITDEQRAAGEVDLDFYHVGGLLRITLRGVKADTKVVKVTFPGKKVTGTFTVSKDADTDMLVINTAESSTENTVTFTVSDGETALNATSEIVLNVPVPCGSYKSVTVETYNAATATVPTNSQTRSFASSTLNFARHHGKKLAFGALYYDYTLSDISPVTLTNVGGTAVLSSDFVSYRIADGETEKEEVPFEFEYSEDGTTWTDGLPDWLDYTSESGGSTEGMKLALTMKPQKNTVTEDEHTTELKSRDAAVDFDLSTYNAATGLSVARTTSNCYIVSAPGTYKFPLVYGNGVVGGANNENAYRATIGPGGSYRADEGTENYLGSFKDHLDRLIYNGGNETSSPYIAVHLDKTAAEITPVLIWTDEPGLVDITSLSVWGSNTETYLGFSVPANHITPGNAVIGIRVGGKIAWSWHIWVTDVDMSMDKAQEGFDGYKFAPFNVGWCPDKMVGVYEERSYYVRVVQTLPGGEVSDPVLVTQKAKTILRKGNSPYYQWGRKDPLEPGIINITTEETAVTHEMVNKIWYDQDGLALNPSELNGLRGAVSVGGGIQNPGRHICDGEGENSYWCSTFYHNLWNSVIDGHGHGQDATPVDKTIYDPSPAGYKMGPQSAWSGFTDANFAIDTPFTGRTYNGVYFPALGRRSYMSADLLGLFDSPDASHQWTAGRYWTATPGGIYSAADMVFGADGLDVLNSSARSMGFTIRPVLE